MPLSGTWSLISDVSHARIRLIRTNSATYLSYCMHSKYRVHFHRYGQGCGTPPWDTNGHTYWSGQELISVLVVTGRPWPSSLAIRFRINVRWTPLVVKGHPATGTSNLFHSRHRTLFVYLRLGGLSLFPSVFWAHICLVTSYRSLAQRRIRTIIHMHAACERVRRWSCADNQRGRHQRRTTTLRTTSLHIRRRGKPVARHRGRRRVGRGPRTVAVQPVHAELAVAGRSICDWLADRRHYDHTAAGPRVTGLPLASMHCSSFYHKLGLHIIICANTCISDIQH